MLLLAGTKVVACLLASDFPSENPRPQTRNFCYTKTLVASITSDTTDSNNQQLISKTKK